MYRCRSQCWLLVFKTIILSSLTVFTHAKAACIGGSSVKGNFGVLINGTVVTINSPGGPGTELFSGSITSNGKCSVFGTLVGGLTGAQWSSIHVTGSYSVATNGQGTMNLELPNSTPATLAFNFGVVNSGKELVGVQTDGFAVATFDLTRITAGTYTNASINGVYTQTCFGSDQPVGGNDYPTAVVDYETFDGAGHFYGHNVYDNYALGVGEGTYSGTYTVNPNGTYSTQFNPPLSAYQTIGAIVNGGTELHGVVVSSSNSFEAGPEETCVEKR